MSRLARARLRGAIAAAAVIAVLAGCSSTTPLGPGVLQGTGAVKSDIRTLADFTKVEVRHGMKLELTIGTPAKVELTAQENLLPISSTTVADGRLTVDASRDYSSAQGITVKVTMPTLSELALVGGARGRADGIQAGALTVRTEGGAILAISGTAETLALTAKGGGDLDLGAFTAKDATVDLAGGVKATVGVNGSATGSATGFVVLTLKGNPTNVDISTTGGALVIRE